MRLQEHYLLLVFASHGVSPGQHFKWRVFLSGFGNISSVPIIDNFLPGVFTCQCGLSGHSVAPCTYYKLVPCRQWTQDLCQLLMAHHPLTHHTVYGEITRWTTNQWQSIHSHQYFSWLGIVFVTFFNYGYKVRGQMMSMQGVHHFCSMWKEYSKQKKKPKPW